MKLVVTVLLTFDNESLKKYGIYYTLKIETKFYKSNVSIGICDAF